MTIFLDMDGVIANFVGSLEKHLNEDLSELDQWNIGKYLERDDIDNIINTLDHGFWSNVQPYDNLQEIVQLCEYYSQNNVFLCSSPPNHSGSYSGKKAWVDKHLPAKYSRRLILMKQKHLLANKHHTLIDDGEYQTLPFIKRGGHAITYPQPWNSYCFVEDKLEFLDAQLKTITGR